MIIIMMSFDNEENYDTDDIVSVFKMKTNHLD